jgi:hypothetical protein
LNLGNKFWLLFKYALVFTPTTTLVKRVLIFIYLFMFCKLWHASFAVFFSWFGNKLGAEKLQVFGLL